MPTFTREGVQLHYELDGSGPPVVYVSGHGSHSNDAFGSSLRPLLAQRYTVLAVDNRGAGQTRVAEDASVTFEDMADDIAAIMDDHQMGAAHVLGISMGGCIALTLALRHPHKVRSQVVAVSSARTLPSRSLFMLDTLRKMLDASLPCDIINRYWAVLLLSEAVFQDEAFIHAFVNTPPDPYEQTRTGHQQQSDAERRFDIRARLPSIAAPTLVISSPDDLLAPPRLQEEIVGAIPGAEIKRYPGGHVAFVLPMCIEQFVQDVVAFWERHP